MKPANRLRRSAEIQRVRSAGKSWAVGPVVLYAAARQEKDGPVRAAFIAGKKVGDAVYRNKAKRQMREAFRAQIPYIEQGWDLIWIARPSIRDIDFERIRKSVLEALKRGRLVAPVDKQPPPAAKAQANAEVLRENSSLAGDPGLSKDDQPGSTPDLPVHS